MKHLKRAEPPPSPVVLQASAGKDAILGKMPAVGEYLMTARWDDGKARQTSTLLLFVDEGVWKACLNDRDGQRVAFVTDDTFSGLLGLLEAQLQDGSIEWRAARPWKRSGR